MSLAPEVLRLVEYPPERVVESHLIANLVPGGTEFLNLYEIEPYLVWLKRLSFDRNPNVSAMISAQVADRGHENMIPYGAATTILDDYTPLNVAADHSAFVRFTNAAAAIPNYQARVVYEVHNYSVAQKLAQGIKFDLLEDAEQEVATKYDLAKKIAAGELPMKYPSGPLLYQNVGNFSGNLAANEEVNMLEKTVPEGCKVVLRFVWANHPAANFGALMVRVHREKSRFMDIYPYMMPNFTTITRYIRPLDLWIPALNNLRVTIRSTTGHVGVLAQVIVAVRKLPIFDKLSWNRRLSSEEKELVNRLDLSGKLKAGIYNLVTPLPSMVLGRESD